MIPKEHIIEWKETVPWTDAQMVEQDLIICRALVAIYNDNFCLRTWHFVVAWHCTNFICRHSRDIPKTLI